MITFNSNTLSKGDISEGAIVLHGCYRKRKQPLRDSNMGIIKKICLTMAMIAMLVALLIGIMAGCAARTIKQAAKESIELVQPVDKEEIKQMTNPNIEEKTAAKLRDHWTVAVFGVDSRKKDALENANSDVIMLVTLEGETGKTKIVSVYRDTCLKTGKNSYFKANSAYASGGPKAAVAMLNENLDLDIDDYIAFNWKAVVDAVNILGGVDIDITKSEFKYINAYITETVKSTGVGSTQLKSAGPAHLDGVQAVAYARLRLMDNDFKRTERQRKVLDLLLEKAVKAGPGPLNNLIQTVLPQTASSIEADDLYAVMENILKIKKPDTMGFPEDNFVRTVEDASYVFPDDLAKNVSALHGFLYGEEDYEPSKAVKSISEMVAKKSRGSSTKRKRTAETEAEPTTEETEETGVIEETEDETETGTISYEDWLSGNGNEAPEEPSNVITAGQADIETTASEVGPGVTGPGAEEMPTEEPDIFTQPEEPVGPGYGPGI